MRRRSWILLASAAGFVLIQLIRPAPPRAVLPGDGDMPEHVAVPARIGAILRKACYDCHSDETRWPWYARVAPLSWVIVHDVKHGRSNLDFSSWSIDPVREPTPDQRLRWMCEDIRSGEMPPLSYRLLHPAARLTETEKDAICSWSRDARGNRASNRLSSHRKANEEGSN